MRAHRLLALLGLAVVLLLLQVPSGLLSNPQLKHSYLQQQERILVLQLASPPPSTAPTPTVKENWLTYLHRLVDKPIDPDVFVIAYCFFTQEDKTFEPLGHGKFFSEFVGPYINSTKKRVEYRPVVALPKFLNGSIKPNSPLGLILLGLSEDVHVRICSFGSTDIMQVLNSVPGVKSTAVSVDELQNKLKQLGLWQDELLPGEVPPSQTKLWSHDALLYWPPKGQIHFPTLNGKPFGPFIPRYNKEPWFESVPGVTTQFDTKREELSRDSVTVYYPMILNTMSWRLTGREFPNHWSDRVGLVPSHITTIKQALTRPPGFQPSLEGKEYFMAFVHSHCAGPSAYLASVAIRELFAFAVYDLTNKSVNLLGSCPQQGRARAGPQGTAKNKLRTHSAMDTMKPHKFAIVFENSRTSGYMSEKIVNAYLAQTVPIYFGAYREQVERILNRKAFVHCDLPNELVEHNALRQLTTQVCDKMPRKSQDCYDLFQAELAKRLRPHFAKCIEQVVELDQDPVKYLAMVAEPLIHLDDQGDPTGIFSGKAYGAIMAVLMQAFGYKL
ncbi:hypothetical protein BASA81_003333 [Batrachochytrium salamandrivorans]|nr:hypothetical protein BASA81_003333 [Batrachochytrium salamandrivorans]